MGDIVVSNFANNEIAKAVDFNHISERQFENLNTLFGVLLGGVSADVIVHGLTVAERSTPSMNVDVGPGLAYCVSTGKIAHAGSTVGPVSIAAAEASDRIDTIEVQYNRVTFETEQRSYKDPVDETITYADTDTKARYEISVQVITGTAGSGNAPASTAGWVKIAEVLVPAGASEIYDANIRNCTADIDGGATSAWTTGTADTFVTDSIPAIKALYRQSLTAGGDYQADSVGATHIDWGTGSGQVDADIIPIGTTISNTSVGSNAASTSVRALLSTLSDQVDFPVGAIMMFDANNAGGVSGGASGAWQDNVTMPGWYACVAANADRGCPNLVDRFIMGKAVSGAGALGGANSFTIAAANLPAHTHDMAHVHDISHGHSITMSSSGQHSHTIDHSHDFRHTHTGSTTTNGSHTHRENSNNLYSFDYGGDNVGYGGGLRDMYDNQIPETRSAGNHSHSLTINQGGSIIEFTGTSSATGAHVHSLSLDAYSGSVSHTGATGNGAFANNPIDNRPAFYSVIFIRKCA